MPDVVASPLAPRAIGPYSQAIRHGGFLFCSGQVALDPATGTLVGQTAEEQVVQVLENLKAVLAAGGSAPERVLKTTVYLVDMADYPAVNAVYAKTFGGAAPPARAAVAVAGLPLGARVEIDCIAACD